MRLSALFNAYGTDKDALGYTAVYHALLSRRRQEPLTILEIGIGTMVPDVKSSMVGFAAPGYRPGGSLRAWRDYFPRALVIGVDVQPDTQFEEDRIQTYLCDSTRSVDVERVFARLGSRRPDIIVDDGSHAELDQLATLRNFYPYLHDDGVYFLEDLDPGCLINTQPEVLHAVCGNDPLFFAGLENNLCVICKCRTEC